jgi:hypothetical protein
MGALNVPIFLLFKIWILRLRTLRRDAMVSDQIHITTALMSGVQRLQSHKFGSIKLNKHTGKSH